MEQKLRSKLLGYSQAREEEVSILSSPESSCQKNFKRKDGSAEWQK